MQRKISAVLFDMDGLLLDTEQFVLDCFRQTCAGLGLSDMDHVFTNVSAFAVPIAMRFNARQCNENVTNHNQKMR